MKFYDDLKKHVANTFSVDYVTGYAGVKGPINSYILSIEDQAINIHNVFRQTIYLEASKIIGVHSQTQGQVIKSLSMGKAAVGLVLLGPLGALIGAGMRSTHDDRQFFLVIDYVDDEGFENKLVLRTKKAEDIVNHIKTKFNLKKKYIAAKNMDPYEELEKWDKLRKKGIISDSEYSAKKKQLLGI